MPSRVTNIFSASCILHVMYLYMCICTNYKDCLGIYIGHILEYSKCPLWRMKMRLWWPWNLSKILTNTSQAARGLYHWKSRVCKPALISVATAGRFLQGHKNQTIIPFHTEIKGIQGNSFGVCKSCAHVLVQSSACLPSGGVNVYQITF